jgi:hypothetical protein
MTSIRQIATDFLDDKSDSVSTVNALFARLHELPYLPDEARNRITGMYSLVDAIPVGEVRDLWHTDALKKADQRAQEFALHWKGEIVNICQMIVRHPQKD